jgi:hypothetical protein
MNRLASILLISLAACATSSEDTGLTLDVQEADRVGGTYEAGGVAVAFDFSRGEDRHVLAFRSADGRPLITTTVEGAFQTTDVLGGRLVASGIANAPDPEIEGDRAAMAELNARPEAGLLEGLHEALVAAGIDEDLYQPRPAEPSGVYDYDGRYFLFYPGDTRDWLSAAGPSPTYIYVKNPWPTAGACAVVTAMPWGSGTGEYLAVAPYALQYKTVYWWGGAFAVRNWSVPSQWGGQYCQPAQVLIRVSPYSWSP